MIKEEHILLVRNDRLGDAILALPCITWLKRRYHNSRISFLASPYTAPLIRCVEGIDLVIEAHDRTAHTALSDIIHAKLDTAICLRPTFSNALTLFRAGVPIRRGTAYRAYSMLFNDRVKVRRRGLGIHEADLNLALLDEPDHTEKVYFPRIAIPETSFQVVRSLAVNCGLNDLRRTVVLHPGSGGSARDWPLSYFGELSAMLNSIGKRVVFTGSTAEHEKCSRIAGPNDLNFSGATDLITLAALLNSVDLVIAGSTGPLHLANALGTPVLGLYPPALNFLPSRWGPYGHPEMAITASLPLCSRCRPGKISQCYCMEQLTPQMVFTRAKEILSLGENDA